MLAKYFMNISVYQKFVIPYFLWMASGLKYVLRSNLRHNIWLFTIRTAPTKVAFSRKKKKFGEYLTQFFK